MLNVVLKGAFEATMPYLMQRKQFGQPIASFQGMQFQYATCFMGNSSNFI
jgi:alkylation response protein AidB-like acyl-CoA dehydrogenase